MAEAKQSDGKMAIPMLNTGKMRLTLVGDSPLIVHSWSVKAKKEMLDKQTKKAKQAKEAKNPEQDFMDSLYRIEGGGFGFPSVGFKAAAVTACTSVDGITKVAARQAFHVLGELARVKMAYNEKEMKIDLARIEGEPEMREDMVRIGMGTADIRYRPQFMPWKTTLTVKWNRSTLSVEQIVNLFNIAGFGVGVGEWRPEKDGTNGMFHVESHEVI